MESTKRDRDRDRQLTMRRPRRPRILHYVAITAVSLLALAGLLVLVFWLVVRPSLLRCSVDKAHLQGFNITNNALSATFNLTLDLHNPNRKVVAYYDRVEVAVWYDGQMLALNEVAPFYQPRRDVRMLKVDLLARSMPLLSSVATSLKQDRSAGEAAVEVRMRAMVRFKVGLLKTDHYTLRAYCSPVLVRFSSPATQFQKVYCDVYI
ncbi:hypothetical protein BHE74_00002174 [Ensete ventricosum]|nr:hypothetical protein BHE74_00002174 [Ensete ventricosum]